MATQPYIGEIRVFSFNYNPRNWAPCNGQLMAIQQNQALFAILGTTYGGNGTTTFALPNFQGQVPIHWGNGGGSSYNLGERGGSSNVTLLSTQLAAHTHLVSANTTASATTGANNFPASPPSGNKLYGPTPDTAMNATILLPKGGSLPHNNLQPYLTLNFCIALFGIFPSRN